MTIGLYNFLRVNLLIPEVLIALMVIYLKLPDLPLSSEGQYHPLACGTCRVLASRVSIWHRGPPKIPILGGKRHLIFWSEFFENTNFM